MYLHMYVSYGCADTTFDWVCQVLFSQLERTRKCCLKIESDPRLHTWTSAAPDPHAVPLMNFIHAFFLRLMKYNSLDSDCKVCKSNFISYKIYNLIRNRFEMIVTARFCQKLSTKFTFNTYDKLRNNQNHNKFYNCSHTIRKIKVNKRKQSYQNKYKINFELPLEEKRERGWIKIEIDDEKQINEIKHLSTTLATIY